MVVNIKIKLILINIKINLHQISLQMTILLEIYTNQHI